MVHYYVIFVPHMYIIVHILVYLYIVHIYTLYDITTVTTSTSTITLYMYLYEYYVIVHVPCTSTMYVLYIVQARSSCTSYEYK